MIPTLTPRMLALRDQEAADLRDVLDTCKSAREMFAESSEAISGLKWVVSDCLVRIPELRTMGVRSPAEVLERLEARLYAWERLARGE